MAADRFAAKLSLHTKLSDAERAALAQLIARVQTIPPGGSLAAVGEPLDVATIVLDGVVCRSKALSDGRRQILSLLLPGDMVDAHATVLRKRDDNLDAVSKAEVAVVPQSRLARLGEQYPRLHEAFMREALIEAAVIREWVLNVGQRSALEALAHLLCELRVRMSGVGLAAREAFPFPLKQQDLADALGLSTIHVNRVFRQLRETGLVQVGARALTVLDWPGLQRLAHFSPSYLHFDEANAA